MLGAAVMFADTFYGFYKNENHLNVSEEDSRMLLTARKYFHF